MCCTTRQVERSATRFSVNVRLEKKCYILDMFFCDLLRRLWQILCTLILGIPHPGEARLCLYSGGIWTHTEFRYCEARFEWLRMMKIDYWASDWLVRGSNTRDSRYIFIKILNYGVFTFKILSLCCLWSFYCFFILFLSPISPPPKKKDLASNFLILHGTPKMRCGLVKL